MTSERNIVINKFDLEEVIRGEYRNPSKPQSSDPSDFASLRRTKRAQMTKYLWDHNFQGNRYVILYEESDRDYQGKDVLKTPLDYNQNKQDDEQFKKSFKTWYQQFSLKYHNYPMLSRHSQEFNPQN